MSILQHDLQQPNSWCLQVQYLCIKYSGYMNHCNMTTLKLWLRQGILQYQALSSILTNCTLKCCMHFTDDCLYDFDTNQLIKNVTYTVKWSLQGNYIRTAQLSQHPPGFRSLISFIPMLHQQILTIGMFSKVKSTCTDTARRVKSYMEMIRTSITTNTAWYS